MTNKTDNEFGITVGTPVTERPGGRTVRRGEYDVVAQIARDYEGQYVPVTLPGKSEKTLKGLPTMIRTGRTPAFKDGKYDAVFDSASGQLYVAFLGESDK